MTEDFKVTPEKKSSRGLKTQEESKRSKLNNHYATSDVKSKASGSITGGKVATTSKYSHKRKEVDDMNKSIDSYE